MQIVDLKELIIMANQTNNPQVHGASEKLKAAALERWQEKQIRRTILSDFRSLGPVPQDGDMSNVIEFILQHEEHIDLMRDALGSYKTSKDFYAVMVWNYLSGGTEGKIGRLVLERKLLDQERTWFESQVPNPIIFQLDIATNGPNFDSVTSLKIAEFISRLLGESGSEVKVHGDFPFLKVGEYPITFKFLGRITISRTIRLELRLEPMPKDWADVLVNVPDLALPNDQEPLKWLQHELEEISPTDILTYHPRTSQVLTALYQQGYWDTPWANSIRQEWKARRGEYIRNLQLKEVSEYIKHINQHGPWAIPEEDDTETLSKQRIIEIARNIIATEPELLKYRVDLRLEGEVDRATLSIEVLTNGLPAGKLKLIRSVEFLPTPVRREIQQADIHDLGDIVASENESDLLAIARRETEEALIPANYQRRASQLAGICRILLEHGYFDSEQLKYTLSCYYAARGGELIKSEPLKARMYYLLFFRMLYQEGMLEQLKAFRELEYAVAANLFATYALPQSRTTAPPSMSYILHERSDKYKRRAASTPSNNSLTHVTNEELRQQSAMWWRAAQLLSDSPDSFFDALLSLYEIDDNFVRNILVDMRKEKRLGNYDLEYLNVDSTRLLRDIVFHSIEKISSNTNFLLGFVLSVLDARDVAQPVFNELRRVFVSAIQFMGAKDAVQKSALFTDVDREFLQTRVVIDRLTAQLRYPESVRRKASRLRRLLDAIKAAVDQIHHDFFRSARLQAEVNTYTLPRNELSPIEILIRNLEFGVASNVVISLERDSSFFATDYEISVESVFGKEERILAVYISPLADRAVELRGRLEYSDQEAEQKSTSFRHTINVSDPNDFENFNSPYVTGDPVRNSEMFFGRRKELEEVIRLLRGHYQDRVTVIHGRRRVGKTSILYQLKQGAPDLLAIQSLADIQLLYLPVILSFERLTADEQTWKIYYHIYQNIRQDLSLVNVQSNSIEMTDFRDLSDSALLEEFLINIIPILKERNQKLLLMCDEFDNLIRINGEERGLFGFIREMIIKYGESISFIFVGADEMVGMMQDRANRLYSMAGKPLEIQDLTDEEARLLVTEPMRKVEPRFEWAEGAVRLLVDMTSGNPYYIQTLCDRVVNNLIAGKRLRATTIDVEQAIKDTVDHIGDLADIVKKISSVQEKAVLACLAEITKDEKSGRSWVTGGSIEQKIDDNSPKFPRRAIPSILRSLRSRYILEQRGSENMELEYSFRVPLLRIYIQNSFKLMDVLREGGYL